MEYLGCFYSEASHDFQRGMLPVARTIKAECDDLCVVEIRGGWTEDLKETFDKANAAIKDNWNVKCEEVGVLQGGKWDNLQDISRRVYGTDGVAPTVHTCGGGNQELKIAEPKGCAIRTRAYDGKEAQVEMGGEVANSITTVEKDSMVCETQVRIRKITERESFRLMGVKDEDFDRVAKNQSNSSLRHLAGDSIVVDVLMAIFSQMIRSDANE